MENVLKEIEELTKKANKYDNLKERNQEIINNLQQVQSILDNTIKILNPYYGNEKTNRSGLSKEEREKFKEIRNEIIDKMNNGLEMSIELVCKTYNFTESQAYSFMTKMQYANKNIGSRKDGKIRLWYIKKEM